MNSRGIWCVAACFVGLAMLGVSQFWFASLAGQMVWSEQDAELYVAAAGKLHQITYEHAAAQSSPGKMLGGMHRAVSDGELAAAKDAWETQKNKRDDAIRFVEFWGNALFGLGILLAGGGAASFFIFRNMADES